MRGVFSGHCSELEGCGDGYRISHRSGVEPLRSAHSQVQLCGGDRIRDRRACEIPLNR